MPQPETSAAAVKTNIMRFIQWLPPHPPPDPAQHRFRAPRPFAPRATAPKPAHPCPLQSPRTAARPDQACCRSDMRSPSFLRRSEEHTSELQSLMRTSYAVFCLKTKKEKIN